MRSSIPSRLAAAGLAWLLAAGLAMIAPTPATAEETAEPSASAAAEPAEPATKPEPKSEKPERAEEAEPKAKPEPAAPPAFVEQPPAKVTAQTGEKVTLKAKVRDADDYQWQSLESAKAKHGKDVAKATAASFEPGTGTAGVFHFRLRASNPGGSATSETVTLTVTDPAPAEADAGKTPAEEPADAPADPDQSAATPSPAPARPSPTPDPTPATPTDPPSTTAPPATPVASETDPGAPSDPAIPTETAPAEPTPTEQPTAPVTADNPPSLAHFAVSPLAGTPGASSDNGDGTSTYTHWDGETVTYPNQVVAGEPITLSGAGWLTKDGWPVGDGDLDIREGDEGSITGIKFFGPGGAVVRNPKPANPWNGATDYASPDVWEIAQAAGTGSWWNGATPGSWRITIGWPTAANGAVAPPTLNPGDSFYLQLLSGTLYGNTIGAQDTRPDVSRTIRLDIAVTDPQTPADDHIGPSANWTGFPTDEPTAVGEAVSFAAFVDAQPAPTVRWEWSDNGTDWTEIADSGDIRSTGGTEYSSYHQVSSASAEQNGRQYRAVFRNTAGEYLSRVATLWVAQPVVEVLTGGPHHRGDLLDVRISGLAPGAWGGVRTYLTAEVVDQQGRAGFDGLQEPGYLLPGADGVFTGTVKVPYYLASEGDATAPGELFPTAGLRIRVRQQGYQSWSYSAEFSLRARTDQPTAPRILSGPSAVIGAVGELASTRLGFEGGGDVVWYHTRATGSFTGRLDSQLTAAGESTAQLQLGDHTHPGASVWAYVLNERGWVRSATVTSQLPAAPSLRQDLPASAVASVGDPLVLTATASGQPTAQPRWYRSMDGVAWNELTTGVATTLEADGRTVSTLTLARLAMSDHGARFKVVFTNSQGSMETRVLRLTVNGSTLPVTITTHPASQSVEAGSSVTFSAAAIGAPAPTVRWQRSTDGGVNWVDLRGATGTSYTAESVRTALNGARYRAVFTNTASPSGVATNPAALTVTPRENLRQHCATSYGPGAVNSGIEFCFRGPEKVVFGQPIVIEGVGGYLATDNRTGSVVNFFLDAEYSGDPNTVYSKQLFTNPATGQQITDRRTVAIVQADGNGRWRVEIPWPRVDTISTTSDGSGSYTQAALDAKFAPGTTHSFRMLTGSLMNTPSDRQRGASLYYTVVESLADEVGVTKPLYEHQTYTSAVAGDHAVAWVQQKVSSGQTIALSGTGWLTKDKQWGSALTVRLKDETGAYYRRSGAAGDPADPTVWQLVQATEAGELSTTLPLPASAKGGDFVAVELTTSDDGTALGDVARHWVSKPVVIDNSPYVEGPGEGATCTAAPAQASYQLAPGMKAPAANVGGTIRLTGTNWCNLVGGGSLIAIKINDGAYSRLPSRTAPLYDANLGKELGTCPAGICISNKTIWYVIEADRYGSFDVQIPLPTRKNSSPAFGEGAYTLRIMTRTIAADPYYQGLRLDPSRTMKSPEFTVVAEGESLEDVKPGKPSAAPDPLHARDDLTKANRGGVRVDQQAKRWVVTVPKAAPGDWVYLNVYDGDSPRFPWNGSWFEVDANRQVTAPLNGVSLPAGKNRLSVQDRLGDPLGWTTVTVAAPKSKDFIRPITKISRMPTTALKVGQPKPGSTPQQPVAGYADLTDANVGKVTGTEADGKLTLALPTVTGGHWVYLFLYTESGQVVGTDWVQVGTDHTITVTIGKLPGGSHKLALVDAKGDLVGWVTAGGPSAAPTDGPDDAGTDADPGAIPEPGVAGGGENPPAPAEVAPAAPAGDSSGTLILLGLAFLVLAGSAAGVIVLRSPVPGSPAQPRP